MDKPVTAPAEKEIFKAGLSPLRAASVVLELALVAILIPIQPAEAEQTTPITKASAVCQLTPTLCTKKGARERRVATMTTKIATVLYSLKRKAFAPC